MHSRQVTAGERPTTMGALRPRLSRAERRPPFWHWGPFFIILLFLSACTSTRPVVKIGLLAPFEGLYRRTGYQALAAMRAAIADTNSAGIGVLPLALDSSGGRTRIRRTAAKLLIDPTLGAVVGPFSPAATQALGEPRQTGAVRWFAPYAVDPAGGFTTDPEATDWALELVGSVAQAVQAQGGSALVLAGWTPGWPPPSAQVWTEQSALPIRFSDEARTVVPGESVFWMGTPAQGARYLADLRRTSSQAPFWLGPQGGDPVFVERVLAAPLFMEQEEALGPVYWATWMDEQYAQWAIHYPSPTPAAYRVYRATQAAIATALGRSLPAEVSWHVYFFRLSATGEFLPFADQSRPGSGATGIFVSEGK